MFHGSQQKVHYWTAHLWQWHFNATMVNTLQKYAKRWICLSDFSQSNVLHAWWSWLCVYVCVWFMYSLISLSSQLILLFFFTGKIGFLHFYILMRSGSGIIDPWSLALAKGSSLQMTKCFSCLFASTAIYLLAACTWEPATARSLSPDAAHKKTHHLHYLHFSSFHSSACSPTPSKKKQCTACTFSWIL